MTHNAALEHVDSASCAGGACSPPPTHHRHPTHHPPAFREPPQRYSSHTSNLACLSSVPGATAGRISPARWSKADQHQHGFQLPRNRVLCRLLAAMIVLLVFIQALSCGLFFCVRLPFSHSPYVDYRDLISELDLGTSTATAGGSGIQSAAGQVSRSSHQLTAPKLIPRVIHQTYRSARLPATAKQLMRSWQEKNGEGWQVRFYSDEACLNFVRREFPEYFEAYMNLPKDVERADFFRYMVVLRLGGVYADVDVECRQPLDKVIQPADTLLVGWDAELADTGAAAQQHFARQRQVATWFFAAAPGHPVLRELCDHIARNAMTVFSNDTVRDTLERTGQGAWTDSVLRHALQHPAAKHDDPWKVRILPRVAFAVHPSDDAALGPHLPGVVVLHHFLGSWQGQSSWGRQMPAHRKALQIMSPLLPWFRRRSAALATLEPVVASNITHYPVSVDFYPPFTMMTDLVGAGDRQAEADVSAAVTAHGTWQPAVAPYRRPAVVEALVGALSRHSSSSSSSSAAQGATAPAAAGARTQGPAPAAAGVANTAGAGAASSSGSAAAGEGRQQVHDGVLVDVGAGHGFFSLAAAARGHKVIAFETSPGSLAAFKASIAYNGFGSLIDVRTTVLGATPGTVCVQHKDAAAAANSSAAGKDLHASAASSGMTASSSSSRGAADGAAVDSGNSSRGMQDEQLLGGNLLLRRRRGYLHLADEAAAAAAAAARPGDGCAVSMPRLRLSDALANSTGIAVLRISAHGHEGWVVEGAMDLLQSQQRPEVMYIEFCPAAMRAAGYSQPKQLLQQLFDLGYTDGAHAGRVCDKRWFNVTHGMRLQGTFTSGSHIGLQQPTWCKLRPENFELLVDLSDPSVPENVLLVRGQHHAGSSTGGGTASSSSSSDTHAHSTASSSSRSVSKPGHTKSESNESATNTDASSTKFISGQGNSDSSSSSSNRQPLLPGAAAASDIARRAGAGGSAGPHGTWMRGRGVARRVGGIPVASKG